VSLAVRKSARRRTIWRLVDNRHLLQVRNSTIKTVGSNVKKRSKNPLVFWALAGLHPDRAHHPAVLMLQQMAVIQERADDTGVAKIHP
jgi:hypothetical protein